jgi:hypothetical protein
MAMKSYLMACLMLLGFQFASRQGASQNLLYDGDFTTTTSITPLGAPPVPLNTWCSWKNEATVSNFNASVTGGVCKVSFSNAGNTSWEVQLSQYGFTLEPGYHYRLSFDVKADAPRSFGVYFGENEGNWTNLNAANYIQSAGIEWQTNTIEWDIWQTFPVNKLSFEMGAENIPMYFDNIVLEKLNALPIPNIDIIGTSVPPYDWSVGVNMETTDGINYTLSNYTLVQGELKFRQNQDWAINWGATTFPSGFGYQDGPNIPIPPGTYNISFNRLTGVYNFECQGCLPAIGIIGSAVPPNYWNDDVKMLTTDGIMYRLDNMDLVYGELRFRQNSSWTINWGGTTFPIGIGEINSPFNIQIPAGNYDITFNRLTGEYAFMLNIPSIGILGSALNGWNDDIDMQSTDGNYYTLMSQEFSDGEVKFRQDNDWSVNWGGTDFPGGGAYQNGPNIPIPAGKYNVYFYRLWNYYYFERICPDPVLVCPENIVVDADANMCGATVTYTAPYPADNCGYFYIYQMEGLPSGAVYPVGTTTNTYQMFHYNTGKSVTCSFTVTVADQMKPVITDVSTSVASLWPPNHQMVDVQVNYNLSDNCIIIDSAITVTSNEAENGMGDGDATPDWKVMNPHLVQLRAERSGKGSDRIYTITISAKDASGNIATAMTTVLVPHNATGKKGSVDATDDAIGTLSATVTPNPSGQYFNLKITSNSNAPITIKVMDINGRVMNTVYAKNNQSVRFGENLKAGIYLVEILQGTQKTICRVVKL